LAPTPKAKTNETIKATTTIQTSSLAYGTSALPTFDIISVTASVTIVVTEDIFLIKFFLPFQKGLITILFKNKLNLVPSSTITAIVSSFVKGYSSRSVSQRQLMNGVSKKGGFKLPKVQIVFFFFYP
jgi:hypothetical protein